MTSTEAKYISLHSPAYYQISVLGVLDESWAAEFDMALVCPDDFRNNPVTILKGNLPDQAALFGLLMRLYGLGLPLLSVESRLADDE